MTIEQVIRDHLLADAAVAAIVGARGYQVKWPQSPTVPAFMVALAGETKRLHLRGVVNSYETAITVDAIANEFDPVNADPYATVAELADAIAAALLGQVFADGGSPPTIAILACLPPEGDDARHKAYDPDELRLVHMYQEFRVRWRRVN